METAYPTLSGDGTISLDTLIETRHIPIIVDKSHLITIGEKLYTEKMSFVRELVNNAYDADASEVYVDVQPTAISIRDNGSGMDEAGLRQYFTIGSPLKKEEHESPHFRRKRIGEFGIGKFAALAACRMFEVDTQRGEFHARLLFDKESWSKHEDWHLNIDIVQSERSRGDGTIVTLHGLDMQFPLPRLRRYLADHVPIQAPDFAVWLNEERVHADIVAGRRIPVSVMTDYGLISGQIIITPANFRLSQIGLAIFVKRVLIRYESFGMETSRKHGIGRITGLIHADFLPITSSRDDFIRDTPEFQRFDDAMRKEISKVFETIRKENDQKANAQSSRVLKDALSKIGRVIKKYGNAFPAVVVPSGSPTLEAQGQSGYEISRAEFVDSHAKLDSTIRQRLEETKGKKRSRGRPTGVVGDKSVVRTLKVANLSIAVRLEHLGADEESMASNGIIYVNLDHPLYRTYQHQDQLLTQHIARIITKELTLQTNVKNPNDAFALQTSLLTDALQMKGV